MRIKRHTLTILTVSILLVNCSKIDDDIDGRMPVLFSSEIMKADWTTKGTIDNLVETIGVMAFIGTAELGNTAVSNLMYDGNLSKTEGGDWVISPTIYWPSDNYVTSFYAYSPKATNNNGITLSSKEAIGVPIISYQMPELAINQPALMIATPVLDKNYLTSGGRVELELKHALVAIGFQLKGDADAVLNVMSVGIRNIVDRGSISMDNTNIQWELGASTTTLYNAGLNSDTGITSTHGYLMLIPQPQNGAEVVLSFSDTTEKKVIGFPDVPGWEANQPYIYIINLLSSGGISITVQDWTSTEETVPELL